MRPHPAAVALLLLACASSPPAPTGPTPVEMKSAGPTGGAVAQRTVRLTATVQAVDRAARALTVKKQDGALETFKIPPAVKRFDEIAVGDVVVVEATQGLLLQYQPVGTLAVEPRAVVAGGKAEPSEAPAGAVGAGVQGTVTVVEVDPVARIVTLQRPNGERHQVKAGPDVPVEKLQVGDRLLATYVETLAVGIERP